MLLPRRAVRRYVPAAVNFDGSNDYLTRGAALTGAADGKQLTLSGWLKSGVDGGSAVGRILTTVTALAGGTVRLRVQKRTTNDIQVAASNSAGTLIFSVNSSTNSVLVAGGWKHFLCSCDLSAGATHLYLSNASDSNNITNTNDTMVLTGSDFSVGATADGTLKLTGDMADLLFWPSYLDLSVAANRRLFISNGKPVNPGNAIRALGAPLINLSNPLASWHTNKGSGGGFTLTGALTASSSNPA